MTSPYIPSFQVLRKFLATLHLGSDHQESTIIE
jgi:hypothetical protein